MKVLNQRVRAVLRREYLQRVRNKWFLITTLLIPALLIGGIGLSVWLAERIPTETTTLRVGVVDRSGLELSGRLLGSFGSEGPSDPMPGATGMPGQGLPVRARARVEMAPAEVAPGQAPADLGSLLSAAPFDVFLHLPPGMELNLTSAAGTGVPADTAGEIRIVSRASVSSAHLRVIQAAVREAVIASLLERAGTVELSPRELLSAASLQPEVVRTDQAGARSQELLQGLGLALGGVLYFMLLVYGSMIVRGVIEEKSSDIVEVLISSLRPWEMMLGKILGVGAVGLTQVAIWAVVVGGIAAYGLTAGSAALAAAGIELDMLSLSLLPALLAFLGFFLLGYLLYSCLFAAAGALSGGEQDAQQVSMPITIFIIAAVFLLIPVMESPDATWAILVSQVPLFSPILMVGRVSAGMASPLETVSALLVLLLGVAGSVWLAGRIYRVGILMKGKRPSLPELARWVRYG